MDCQMYSSKLVLPMKLTRTETNVKRTSTDVYTITWTRLTQVNWTLSHTSHTSLLSGFTRDGRKSWLKKLTMTWLNLARDSWKTPNLNLTVTTLQPSCQTWKRCPYHNSNLTSLSGRARLAWVKAKTLQTKNLEASLLTYDTYLTYNLYILYKLHNFSKLQIIFLFGHTNGGTGIKCKIVTKNAGGSQQSHLFSIAFKQFRTYQQFRTFLTRKNVLA